VFYGEHFGTARAITFGLIWLGLALFSWDALRARRAVPAPLPPE